MSIKQICERSIFPLSDVVRLNRVCSLVIDTSLVIALTECSLFPKKGHVFIFHVMLPYLNLNNVFPCKLCKILHLVLATKKKTFFAVFEFFWNTIVSIPDCPLNRLQTELFISTYEPQYSQKSYTRPVLNYKT